MTTMSEALNDPINYQICQDCGGRCCQGSPGVWINPDRFFSLFFEGRRLTLEQLRSQLPELNLVLWEKSGVPVPAPQSLITGCFFHGVCGCVFSEEERPCQCLALVPDPDTLQQPKGSQCKLPEAACWDVAKKNWQDYWLRV